MKKIAITNNVEVVLSQNEFGYEAILNDFTNTNRISIVTFNISNEDIQLINKLKKLENVQIQIVTNIPGRYDEYFHHRYDKYKKDASKRINKYLDTLNPNSFKSDTSVFYNFRNHSKIMATDNYAYIGSANFSSESSNNFESGILISDLDIVKKVHEEFVAEIIKHSYEYFGEDVLDDFIVIVREFVSEIERFNDLYLSNIFNRYLSAKEGEKCIDIKYDKLEFKDFDNFRCYISWFIDEYNSISTKIEKYLDESTCKLLSTINDFIINNKSINEFVEFNKDDYLQSSFEDLLIYDDGENTDKLLQLSLENAEFKNDQIIDEASSYLLNLDDFTEYLLELMYELKESLIALKDEEEMIDNTK